MTIKTLQTYLVPGLVIQAVLVGGGYATGRELVEFFLSMGPLSGLVGMGLTAAIISIGSMIGFELARLGRAYDYRSFMGLLLGRGRFLFEIVYFAGLMLVLAIVSAAAGELLFDLLGWSHLLSACMFMAAVAVLVFFGNSVIEKVISAWSVIFYFTYGLLFVLVLDRFGDQMLASLTMEPVRPADTVWNAISYSAYNIPLLPVLIFVARNFKTRREAMLAGAIAGPLILLPGFAFLLTLSAFYPEINQSTLPVQTVLARLDSRGLALALQLVVLGALIKTGAGLLHGFNERLARHFADMERPLQPSLRPLVAIAVMMVAILAATRVGLVDLIGRGYRYSALFYLAVLVIPLFTIGAWRVFTPRKD